MSFFFFPSISFASLCPVWFGTFGSQFVTIVSPAFHHSTWSPFAKLNIYFLWFIRSRKYAIIQKRLFYCHSVEMARTKKRREFLQTFFSLYSNERERARKRESGKNCSKNWFMFDDITAQMQPLCVCAFRKNCAREK